jgi:VWFA-related protein
MSLCTRPIATLVFLVALGIGIPTPPPTVRAAGQAPPAAQPPAAQPPAGQPPAGQPPAGQPEADQPPPPQPGQQRPPFKAGVNFVSVDVIVTDKRSEQVVLDLKPEDFEVREDKKVQKVETFEVIKIDPLVEAATPPREIHSVEDEEREAKLPNVRLFVILLDDYHVRRGSDLASKRPLIDFVENQLGPQDMVAIMYPLTPVTALTFTRNHDSLVSAINKFEGRKGIYEPRNEFEERYSYYPVATVEAIRNDVSMSALKGAAVRLGGMREGRKSIIFVSEGFVSTVPAQLNDPSAAMPGFGNPARRSPGVDPRTTPREDSAQFFNQTELLNRMREVFDTANRNNTSIYAVDPRGLAAFEYDVNQGVSLQTDRQNLNASLDSLRVLADNTDGRAIVNRNDLAAGMKQIMRDASGYYLLGYTSSSAPTDGKFHNIDVRVKRQNVEVRARKGYWAYTNEDVARATAPPKPGPPPAVTSALSSIAEPTRGRSARFWFGTDRGQGGQTRVTFVWEPIPPAPGDRRDAADAPSRVMLTATAADGRPLFRGRVPDTDGGSGTDVNGTAATAASTPAASTTGAAPTAPGASVTFDAPPGPLQLRLVVEGGRGQVVDSSTRDLTVPDFEHTTVSIGTPRVYRVRTARQLTALRDDPKAVPVPGRDFSRAERLFIRFDAFAPGGAAPQVTARLLNRAGQPMSDVPVQPAAAGQSFQIDLPLAALAAGEYVLQLEAKTESGTAQEMVAFRVGT